VEGFSRIESRFVRKTGGTTDGTEGTDSERIAICAVRVMRGRLKLFGAFGKPFMEVPRIEEVPRTATGGLALNLGKLPV
jgi:hypothetical protein